MKARLPYLVFALLASGFVIFLWKTQHQLPERVASHFDIHGRPDGWMARDSAVRFMALIGLGLPLFIVAVFGCVRFIPGRLVNLPHREYWLADERRDESLGWLAHVGAWFGCIMVAFMAALHHMIIKANQLQPPRLDGAPLAAILILTPLLVAGLIAGIILRFPKPPAA
jgi:predicted benzoate:H+ symporter BenE